MEKFEDNDCGEVGGSGYGDGSGSGMGVALGSAYGYGIGNGVGNDFGGGIGEDEIFTTEEYSGDYVYVTTINIPDYVP